MTQSQFVSALETFEQDALQSGDIPGYSNALINLINDFYAGQIKKTPEQLATEMLEFVLQVRRS